MTVEHVRLTRAMIGTRTPDLVKFPEVDVRGRLYGRGEVTMRNIGPHQFVVIPSALDGADKWDIDNPYAGVSVDVLNTLEGDELEAHVASRALPAESYPITFADSTIEAPTDTSFGDEPFSRKRK